MARTDRDLGSLSRMASEKSTEDQIYEAYRRGWEDAHNDDRSYPRNRHGCLKSILVALVIILALLIYFVTSSSQNPTVRKSSSQPTPAPTTTPTEKPAPLAYSATGLFNRYAENEIAADADLKGKLIKVTGEINTISTSIMGEPYVGLDRDRDGISLVTCYFAKDDASKLTGLKKGQKVSITGTCSGSFIGVTLKDCELE